MPDFTTYFEVPAVNWPNIAIATVLIVLIIRSLFVVVRLLLRRKR